MKVRVSFQPILGFHGFSPPKLLKLGDVFTWKPTFGPKPGVFGLLGLFREPKLGLFMQGAIATSICQEPSMVAPLFRRHMDRSCAFNQASFNGWRGLEGNKNVLRSPFLFYNILQWYIYIYTRICIYIYIIYIVYIYTYILVLLVLFLLIIVLVLILCLVKISWWCHCEYLFFHRRRGGLRVLARSEKPCHHLAALWRLACRHSLLTTRGLFLIPRRVWHWPNCGLASSDQFLDKSRRAWNCLASVHISDISVIRPWSLRARAVTFPKCAGHAACIGHSSGHRTGFFLYQVIWADVSNDVLEAFQTSKMSSKDHFQAILVEIIPWC